MRKEKIQSIATKYRKLATSRYIYNEEEANNYERFADFIEDNSYLYLEDDNYETEQDLLDDFNEAEAEIDAQWDSMFPESNDDDSITDYLTK